MKSSKINFSKKLKYMSSAIVLSTAVSLAPTTQANAAVTVLDNSVLLQVKSVLSNAQSQLGQLQQIFSVVKNVQNAIGQFGIGNLQNMLGQISSLKGLFDANGLQNLMSGIAPSIGDASSFGNLASNGAFTQQLGALQQAMGQSGNGVGAIKGALGSAMFINSQGASQSDVEGLMNMRNVASINATNTALASSMTMQDYISKNGTKDVKELAEQASSASDERSDIQANTAVLIKMLDMMNKGMGMNASFNSMGATNNYKGFGALNPAN